jgi:hypothetical protein
MSFNQPPDHEVAMTAAMVLSPTVRAWALAMGVTSQAFTHADCKAVYDVIVGGGTFDAPMLQERRERPFTCQQTGLWRNLEDAVLYYSAPCWTDNHGLLMAFQRGAHLSFARWGIPILKWAVRMLDEGADGRVVRRAAEVLAFAAWERANAGVWVYNPGKECLVQWDSYTEVEP